MELPMGFLQGQWPFTTELDLLQRAQAMNASLDTKIATMTRDFRAHRFYPSRTEIKSLELHVYHTFTPPVQAADDGATPGAPGRWTLHLQAMDTSMGTPTPVNLVHFFRKISIELDPRVYSDSMVEWTCFQKGNHEVNALQVARHGHTAHSVRIKLLPSHPIDRVVLSDELRSALLPYFSTSSASPQSSYTKSDVVMATWEYIKRKNLIKEDDCRVAICDATLRQLFQCDSLPFASIVMALRPHLTAAPAFDWEYHLPLDLTEEDKDKEKRNEQIVHVDVGYADEVEKARELALHKYEELQNEQHKEMAFLQQQEQQIVEKIHQTQLKHTWMNQFANDPARFIADLLQSQQADQQILTAEAETDEVCVPHPHQFTQPWVRQVVSELLIPPPTN